MIYNIDSICRHFDWQHSQNARKNLFYIKVLRTRRRHLWTCTSTRATSWLQEAREPRQRSKRTPFWQIRRRALLNLFGQFVLPLSEEIINSSLWIRSQQFWSSTKNENFRPSRNGRFKYSFFEKLEFFRYLSKIGKILC